MHSAFLGELLNPAGSHGLKDTFLRLFVEAVNQKLSLETEKFPGFNTAAAYLAVEHSIGQITADYQQGGRIDIYLESDGDYIFIENKIYAEDQQNQLARYKAYRPNARLLYLTLDGKKAPEWSAGELTTNQYQAFSYKEDIANWLEKCRQAASAYPLVRETIVQYQHLINYLTGNTPNDFMKEEMKYLLQSSQDNFVSAAALGQAFDEARGAFVACLKQELEKVWETRFSQNLSPLPAEFAIYFRVRNGNVYGFQVERDGKEVNVQAEDRLKPLVELALSINKITRPKSWKEWDSWLGWKGMDGWALDNLPLEELYQAATNQEARTQLFNRKMQEAMPYFEQFLNLANAYKGNS